MPAPARGVLRTLTAAGYPLAPPDAERVGTWLPVEELSRAEVAVDLVRRYTAWLGVPRLAAGAACATQHYAGRVAGLAVGTWALTGEVVPLRGAGLLAEVDEHGRTLRLVVPAVPPSGPGAAAEVVGGLQSHLRDLLAAARAVSGISERLAWGGVATSVAGAFVRALHMPHRRGDVLEAAHAVLGPEAWPTRRPLVTLDADGRDHRRHTCCLIYTSPTHEECHTCPRRARAPRSS